MKGLIGVLLVGLVCTWSGAARAQDAQERNARAAELLELKRQEAEVNIIPPIAVAAAGAGMAVASISLGIQSLQLRNEPCSSDGPFAPDCTEQEMGEILGYTAIGLAGVGTTLLAVGLPLMFKRLRQRIRAVRGPQLTALRLDLGPGRAQASAVFRF